MKRIYFSLRNLLLYRDYRDVGPESFDGDIESAPPGGAMMLLLTNVMLAGLGLRVVERDGQLRGIYLTKAQRRVVALVGEAGYKVGLR